MERYYRSESFSAGAEYRHLTAGKHDVVDTKLYSDDRSLLSKHRIISVS